MIDCWNKLREIGAKVLNLFYFYELLKASQFYFSILISNGHEIYFMIFPLLQSDSLSESLNRRKGTDGRE